MISLYSYNTDVWLRSAICSSLIRAFVDHHFVRKWRAKPLFEWVTSQEKLFEKRTKCCVPTCQANRVRAQCLLDSLFAADMWNVRDARINQRSLKLWNDDAMRDWHALCLNMMFFQRHHVLVPPNTDNIFRMLRLFFYQQESPVNLSSYFEGRNDLLFWFIFAAFVRENECVPTMEEWSLLLEKELDGLSVQQYANLASLHKRIILQQYFRKNMQSIAEALV